jgi:hypothetical protein
MNLPYTSVHPGCSPAYINAIPMGRSIAFRNIHFSSLPSTSVPDDFKIFLPKNSGFFVENPSSFSKFG